MKKYSLVVYLEGEAKDKVLSLQEELFEITGSREAFSSWDPHTTVGNGIWITKEELKGVEITLQNIANSQNKFEVNLEGFDGKTDRKSGEGEMATPYVLWIDVQVNQAFENLVGKIKEGITSKYKSWYNMPLQYKPHVTLAFRDLTEDGYKKGDAYLKERSFKDSFQITHIALVENLPDKDVEYKRFYFKK